MKKIRWLEIALQDLDESADYIARYNLTAAQKLVRRIEKAVPTLSDNPEMGRPGRVPGTRELVITGTSYIVAYRLKDNEIQILRILHGARKWPGKFHD